MDVRTEVSLQVIRRTVTAEGEVIPVSQLDIQVENPLRSNGIFLVSPLIISHTMERGSPLYELSAQSLSSEDLEIIVVLEGQEEQTWVSNFRTENVCRERLACAATKKNINSVFRRHGVTKR